GTSHRLLPPHPVHAVHTRQALQVHVQPGVELQVTFVAYRITQPRRDDDLPRPGHVVGDAGGEVDVGAVEVVLVPRRLARWQAGVDRNRLLGVLGAVAGEAALDGDRALDAGPGALEDDHEAVAAIRDLPPTVRLHLLPHEGVVRADHRQPAVVPQPLGHGRRA